MNKSWPIFFCMLVSCSSGVHAGPEALEALLENGAHRLKISPSCEPYQLSDGPMKDSETLAQDVAWVLADMSGKSINTEANCELDSQSKKKCKVIFSIGEGELEWARVYQFERIVAKKNAITLKDLTCFNLP